jgi:hypothetical protein
METGNEYMKFLILSLMRCSFGFYQAPEKFYSPELMSILSDMELEGLVSVDSSSQYGTYVFTEKGKKYFYDISQYFEKEFEPCFKDIHNISVDKFYECYDEFVKTSYYGLSVLDRIRENDMNSPNCADMRYPMAIYIHRNKNIRLVSLESVLMFLQYGMAFLPDESMSQSEYDEVYQNNLQIYNWLTSEQLTFDLFNFTIDNDDHINIPWIIRDYEENGISECENGESPIKWLQNLLAQ